MDKKDEHIIKSQAIAYARANKKRIIKKYTSTSNFAEENIPVSMFMAGSPGAGKTESSRRIIEAVDRTILRIDADELRSEFKEYNGTNSHLFQAAASILVDAIHDRALKNSQSFILDGTFSKYEKSLQNIERSLKRGRFVQIMYIYQDPLQAWDFVKKREEIEGRRIKKSVFVNQFFFSREVVDRIKEQFGDKVRVDLLSKNIDGTDAKYIGNIERIDNHIRDGYTEDSLNIQL